MTTNAFLPLLRAAPVGRIVNITSAMAEGAVRVALDARDAPPNGQLLDYDGGRYPW